MKKSLFLHLSVLAVLVVSVISCSPKTAEYTNAIPADATKVVSINLKSLAEKAEINDKENKEALTKLTDAMKSGMNASTIQQLEAVIKDPSKSGLDITAPVYFFSAPAFDYPTVVAKVSNEDDLKSFFEATQKDILNSPVTAGDGYSFVQAGKQILLTFNASTFLAVSYKDAAQLDKVKEGIARLLKQTEEKSINKSLAFKKMQKLNGEVNLLISPSATHSIVAKQFNFGIPKGIDLKDLMSLASLSFEKGKIEIQIENYTEDPELKAIIEKQLKGTCPIENTFLKYFPKTTIALCSIGLNGEEFYYAIQENELFRNELSDIPIAGLKDMFNAFQNDLTLGLINVTMGKSPSFLAYATVKDKAFLKNLYEKKGKLGLKSGEEIVKLNEDEYVYKSRPFNVFFGVRDKQMYATNDELLYKDICKKTDPSAQDADYASSLKGKCFALVINAEAVLDLPVVKLLAGYGGAEYKMYYSLVSKISYLETTNDSDSHKSAFTLQLKDKNVNALKQILNFVKEFAGM